MAEVGSSEVVEDVEQSQPHLQPGSHPRHTQSSGDDGVSPIERSSPASSVCYAGPLDFETDRTSRNYTPSHDGSNGDVEDDGEHTPRSEVPSNADSGGGEVGYFSPRPMRYFSTSMNTSSTSIDGTGHGPRSHPSSTHTPDPVERPPIARDHPSSTSTASTSTLRPTQPNLLVQEYAGQRSRDIPAYPNQAHSALHSQQYFLPRMRGVQPTFVSRSANTILTLHGAQQPSMDAGSRTVGHSPASSPGLYSPAISASRPIDPTDDSGSYPSPYLHFTHRQAPKETHVADVDVDPVTGRKLINQYEVIDELGRGNHGKVKLGRNVETGDFVAIKIVERYSKKRRLGKNNGSHVDKIKKEIAILKKARHPNIVGLLEVIDDPQRRKVYIVLEHVEMGEVRWRTEGAEEIVLIDYRRHRREVAGIFENEAAMIEDDKILQQAATRREREERLTAQQRRKRKPDLHAWSFEHGGSTDGSDSESEQPEQAYATAVIGSGRDKHSRTDHSQYQNPEALDSERTAEAPLPPRSKPDAPSQSNDDHLVDQTGLEGTMYGAYEPEVPRGRTPSIGSSLHSFPSNSLDAHDIPENFRYVPLMTLSTARAVFRDTVLGLEYLHYQGVIHRDIKPANLLQAKNHHVKISDFGVSFMGRSESPHSNEDQSESEAPATDPAKELARTVGTPAFYAPELCGIGGDDEEQKTKVSSAIDIWSLGITLYCFIFGRVPFHDTNIYSIMKEIAEEEVYIPQVRLKAVDDRPSSRPGSRSRVYQPINSNKRAAHELAYEPISEELHDLLRRIFVKDPDRRIKLAEIKHHPWVLGDISDPRGWLDETDPNRQTQGQKIEVSNEDVAEAVVPYHLVLERVRSGLRRIGGGIQGALGIGKSGTNRKRAKSSAALDDGNSSANSSSSTISQDGRRASLRVDDQILSALRAPREAGEHPLSQSVTASPESKEQSSYFPGPSSSSSRTGSPVVPTYSEASSQALVPTQDRSDAASMFSTNSARTIRYADADRSSRYRFPITSSTPTTPLAHDAQPSPSGLSGLFGGAGRRIMRTVRSRDRSLGRARSSHSLTGSDDDPHCEPSVAVSNMTVAGHVDLPPSLVSGSPSSSIRPSPGSTGTHSMASPDHLRPRDTGSNISRHSSLSSVASSFDYPAAASTKDFAHANHDYPYQHRSVAHSISSSESTEDRYNRLHSRRESQPRSRPLSGLYYPPLMPSQYDRISPNQEDELYRTSHMEGDDALRTQILDRSVDPSPPTSRMSIASKPITSSSSEDHMHSGMSQSTSNPSIPSVMSANSSIVTDGGMADSMPDYKGDSSNSEETLNNPSVIISGEPTPDDEHDDMNPFDHYDRAFQQRHSPESCADDEEEDDSDSDNFTIDLARKRSRSQTAPPRSESTSSVSRIRSRPSARPLRSGSNGTVKKVRRRDSELKEGDASGQP